MNPRRTSILIILVACTALLACNANEVPGEGFQICDDSMNLPNDSYAFTGAEYVGDDTLEIDVGYSGGCETHQWTLCWDGSFMESEPVQANLSLHHNANGDMCEAYIEETLEIDISALRQSYEEGYQTDSGTIIVQLSDHNESVTYEW